jgi:predicted nucleic acid-binding protein
VRVLRGDKLVTDAEVFQEILHRHVAIRRPEAIQPAFDVLRATVDQVLPIGETEIRRAKEIVLGATGRSARDALHLAAMEQYGIPRVLSFDRGFDGHPGIERIFR